MITNYLNNKIIIKMKKFFLLFAVMGLFTFTATAQKKACSMAKKATCTKSSKTVSVDANNPAAVLAAQDDSIEERVCAKSGSVSYVQKNVCAKSGNVSFTNVEYNATTKKFVNVSPSDMEAEAAPKATKTSAKPACSKSKASCTKSAVKATKVSKVTTAKKACAKTCSKKTAACASKGKSKVVSTTSANAKLVKNEE